MSYLQPKPAAAATPAPESLGLAHSSFLQAATYDSVNYSLTIDLKSGHQIVYRFVFPVVWQQFKESPSHGSFYSRNLKGKYPSVSFHTPLKVSDLTRHIKEHRPHAANKH